MAMKHIKIWGLILLTAMITACSSTSPEEKLAKQEQRNQVLNDRVAKSEALVTALEQRLDQSNSDNLKYFAPDQLEDAIDAYKDAKEEYDEIAVDRSEATKGQVARIAENAQKANVALDLAYNIKTNAETILAESFDIRNQLKTLGAPSIKKFARLYKSLSEDIDDVVEEVADGDLEDARSENGQLLPKLRALEVNVVKHIELADARSRIATLKKARATRYVPNAYKASLSAYRASESTIANDPRAVDAIKASIADATFQLERTRHMLQAVQELSNVKSNAREVYLTKYENAIHKIGQAAGAEDFRNTSITAQFDSVAAVVTTIKQELDSANMASQASSNEATKLIQDAQQKASALEALVSKKEQQIQAQEQTNTQLKTKLAELEATILEKEKQVLLLEKEKLQKQNKQIEQANSQAVAPVQSVTAPVQQPVDNTEQAANDAEQPTEEPQAEEADEEEQEPSDPPA